ncbi:MAG: hypothetical protein HY014_10970 [Acidobacteria bacterium]|nr:hypothetical protein [Acidobacteriota bacterium]MBI3488676.1 hypothetical protein [Acidobacteriota bacterium]
MLPLVLLAIVVGTTILVVKSDKASIRRAIEEKGGELIDIAPLMTSFSGTSNTRWHSEQRTEEM